MQDLIGVLLIIVSGISFGAAAIFARFAYEAGTNPITLLFLRFGIAALCMLFLAWLRSTPFPRGRVLLGLILMGAVGYFGPRGEYDLGRYFGEGVSLLVLGVIFFLIGSVSVFVLGGEADGKRQNSKAKKFLHAK